MLKMEEEDRALALRLQQEENGGQMPARSADPIPVLGEVTVIEDGHTAPVAQAVQPLTQRATGSTPPQPPQPVQPPTQHLALTVRLPQDCVPGQHVRFQHEGNTFSIVVPHGAGPEITVNLPLLGPSSHVPRQTPAPAPTPQTPASHTQAQLDQEQRDLELALQLSQMDQAGTSPTSLPNDNAAVPVQGTVLNITPPNMEPAPQDQQQNKHALGADLEVSEDMHVALQMQRQEYANELEELEKMRARVSEQRQTLQQQLAQYEKQRKEKPRSMIQVAVPPNCSPGDTINFKHPKDGRMISTVIPDHTSDLQMLQVWVEDELPAYTASQSGRTGANSNTSPATERISNAAAAGNNISMPNLTLPNWFSRTSKTETNDTSTNGRSLSLDGANTASDALNRPASRSWSSWLESLKRPSAAAAASGGAYSAASQMDGNLDNTPLVMDSTLTEPLQGGGSNKREVRNPVASSQARPSSNLEIIALHGDNERDGGYYTEL